jgi:ABC-type transport system involved in multi-copper enzyme maturation permease subunit
MQNPLLRTLIDAWRIARFDLGTAIRTRRAMVAIVLYALGAFATAVVLVKIEGAVGEEINQIRNLATAEARMSGEEGVGKLEEAISTLVGGDLETARHLLGLPLVILGFFWMSLTFLPYLIVLVSHDIVNVEVRNRSARFVLLRASRTALLVGKMMSHGLLFLGVTVLSNVILFVYAWVSLPHFQPGSAALLLLRIWALTMPFGFCWLAFTALLSSVIDNGGVAMVVGGIAVIVLSMLSMHDTIGFLSPSHYKLALWSPKWTTSLGGAAAYLAFGAVFLGGAWARMTWRDL